MYIIGLVILDKGNESTERFLKNDLYMVKTNSRAWKVFRAQVYDSSMQETKKNNVSH